jgi:hypothetical protein
MITPTKVTLFLTAVIDNIHINVKLQPRDIGPLHRQNKTLG